jgi:hypothetical protein
MNTINVFKRNHSTLSSYRVIKCIHSFILIPNDSYAILYNRHYKTFGMQYDTADLGMITTPIWKCPCINLYIFLLFFNQLIHFHMQFEFMYGFLQNLFYCFHAIGNIFVGLVVRKLYYDND